MTHPLRGAIAAALTAAAPLIVLAQAPSPSPTPAESASSPAAAAKATAPAAIATYKSSFEGYRRFDDQKVLPWRDANDTVGRIGGWQAYARESAGEATSPVPSGEHPKHQSAGPASPQAPAASTPSLGPVPAEAADGPASTPPDAHKGHSMPKKP